MNSFRYLRDPLFLVACALYAINRWGIKPHLDSAFFTGYFNDALLIPCALPLLLWVQRWLSLRRDDRNPTVGEIGLYTLVWSILFEAIGPRVMMNATGDLWDVAAYTGGGIVAAALWNRDRLFSFFEPNR